MLFKAELDPRESLPTLKLEGVIDGTIRFDQVVGPRPDTLRVDCRKILHLNSSAVRPWLEYFHGIVQAGTKLSFVDCPSSLVEYFNMVANFNCGGTIESVLGPFFCPSCRVEVQLSLPLAELGADFAGAKNKACPSCGRGKLELDEEPAAFFQFLRAR